LLGDYFRRIKAKGGHKYAIIATARKIAVIYYRMVRYKEDFTPYDYEQYTFDGSGNKFTTNTLKWIEPSRYAPFFDEKILNNETAIVVYVLT
jgi:hypothetical protein